MKAEHIKFSGQNLDFGTARGLAATLANMDCDMVEPVMVAWHDKGASRMSPAIEGADIDSRWQDYGASHSGKLAVDVNGEFDFIFADADPYQPYGPSPYVSLHDQHGKEYICLTASLRDPHNPNIPSRDACVELDDWTSKLT